MLVTINEVLKPAHKAGYAVGAFNVYNLETAQAVIAAAELENSPVIMAVSEKAIEYAGFDNLTALLIEMAERSKVPVVVHLDHGTNLHTVKKCITCGFSSVMFDASTLPENERIRTTKEIAKFTHKHDIMIEGERDGLAGQEDDIEGEGRYTNPETAAVFVEETNIDAFAVSIGNAHGIPTPDEKLDFPRLEQIAKNVAVPLVLHGASGTPPSQIKQAISLGISKINIDTDLRLSFMATVHDVLINNPELKDPRKMLTEVKKAMTEVVKTKIRLFGSNGRI
ncbi:MAG: class II fructose-bisphosphate aldolase [bacterium]|nr:class II fructose-bisphosphate aldolase [bacterium]